MKISEKAKDWLFKEYQYYCDDLHDTHFWEPEHKRSEEMCEILYEIINELGLNEGI